MLVAAVVRHLGGGTVATKLEAVAAAKVIMKAVRPGPVVEVLLSDDCLHSKSSRVSHMFLTAAIFGRGVGWL